MTDFRPLRPGSECTCDSPGYGKSAGAHDPECALVLRWPPAITADPLARLLEAISPVTVTCNKPRGWQPGPLVGGVYWPHSLGYERRHSAVYERRIAADAAGAASQWPTELTDGEWTD